jgi:hypothetical protein
MVKYFSLVHVCKTLLLVHLANIFITGCYITVTFPKTDRMVDKQEYRDSLLSLCIFQTILGLGFAIGHIFNETPDKVEN